MNFSIVLIARNEEKSLPKLFSSLVEFKNQGGEICVLDTGSTDNTAQVARDFGCKVEEVGTKFIRTIDNADEINNRFIVDGEEPLFKNGDKLFDFAAARNYAATMSSNDMVASPDCDEMYTKLDLKEVQRVIDAGAEQLEYNFVFSHDVYGNEMIKFRHCKFYNKKSLHWKGVVHEVLTGAARNRTYLDESIIKLEHWQNEKQDRGGYIKGLAIDCFENQDNDRNSHYFARDLLWAGRPKSAIKEFKRHIAMNKWDAERGQSMIFIGDSYGQLNNDKEQVEWYQQAFNLDGSRRESLIRLARFYKTKNKPQRVACYVAAAMEIPWNAFYANFRNHYTNEPEELMYWAKGWLGDIPAARKHLLKALEYCPLHPEYLRDTEFYFEYADNGIEGWMTFPELQFLYETSKKMKTICEVGSWKGRSTHALLSGCKGTVTAVDHFQGSADEKDKTHNDHETDKIYLDFTANTQKFNNLKVNKTDSLTAAKDYKDKEFDMVFIDAGHTHDEVVKDIRAWKSKAKVLLCGHDYSDVWAGVKKAVDEEIGKPDGVADTIWYKYIK